MEELERLIGLAGMILVFASFIVKRWTWLYTFNASGATLLALYALLRDDAIFFVVEVGIVMFLLYKLSRELAVNRQHKS
ncbi:MAG: hypothetical protein F7C81_02860 [Desulfurococcales archaeon]|nr:hypothetical protein [Desulfurococcales archaeon]MEB3779037.1 hypothetical protein [Desulfurococcales archaeon]